ncbi:MAG: hypothetical protein RSA23_00795 [Carnobacterium sp.]
MKVKCIKLYYDKEKEEYVQEGDVFDVENKRATLLIANEVVQQEPDEEMHEEADEEEETEDKHKNKQKNK